MYNCVSSMNIILFLYKTCNVNLFFSVLPYFLLLMGFTHTKKPFWPSFLMLETTSTSSSSSAAYNSDLVSHNRENLPTFLISPAYMSAHLSYHPSLHVSLPFLSSQPICQATFLAPCGDTVWPQASLPALHL